MAHFKILNKFGPPRIIPRWPPSPRVCEKRKGDESRDFNEKTGSEFAFTFAPEIQNRTPMQRL
jgi:hypothetical protein